MSDFIISGSFTKPETTDEQSAAEAFSMESRFQQALFDAYDVEDMKPGDITARKRGWSHGDAGPIEISYKFSGAPREISYSIKVEHSLSGYVIPLFCGLCLLYSISDSVFHLKDWPTWLRYVAMFAYGVACWRVVLPIAEFIWNAITSRHQKSITDMLRSAFALRNSFDHQEIAFALMKNIHANCWWGNPKRYPKYVDAFKQEIRYDFLLHCNVAIYETLRDMARSIKLTPVQPSSESDASAKFMANLKWSWGFEKVFVTVLHKPGTPFEITDITLVSHIPHCQKPAEGAVSVDESNPEDVKMETIPGDENAERITPLPRQVLEEKTIRPSYFGKGKPRISISMITELLKD